MADNIRHIGKADKKRPEPIEFIDIIALDQPQPPREWVVQNCIKKNTVCLFSGDSGLGKSLLLMQLQVCAAIGAPWLGFETMTMRSCGIYCEDDKHEIGLRYKDICRAHNIYPSSTDDMVKLMARDGKSSMLVDFNQKTNKSEVSSFYEQVMHHVKEYSIQLLIVDTLAHTFGGNENIRIQVTEFVAALKRIAEQMDGAVILSSHPSVASMMSGTGYSGSTAWRATVRSHMYLKRPKKYDSDDPFNPEAHHDVRILQNMKANYGPGGGLTKLRFDDGTFVLDGDQTVAVDTNVRRASLESSVGYGFTSSFGNGVLISVDHTSHNSLHALSQHLPSFGTFTAQDVGECVDKMILRGTVVVVQARNSDDEDWQFCIRTPQQRYQQERREDGTIERRPIVAIDAEVPGIDTTSSSSDGVFPGL